MNQIQNHDHTTEKSLVLQLSIMKLKICQSGVKPTIITVAFKIIRRKMALGFKQLYLKVIIIPKCCRKVSLILKVKSQRILKWRRKLFKKARISWYSKI